MIKINSNIVKIQPTFANNCLFHPTDAVEDSWGKKIIDQMSKDKAVKSIRIYNMLEDIVYRDDDGNLQYDFRINDLRLDYLTELGFSLVISYAAVPSCLSETFSGTSVSKNSTRYKGKLFNTAPPTDYNEWQQVCYEYTKHIVDRYGIDAVSKWQLQCFNEPDRGFFLRDVDDITVKANEYCKLYAHFSKGVLQVSDRLKIGGPALSDKYEFLEIFLNYVKQNKLRLDFISLHNYGTLPRQINSGERPLKVSNTIENHRIYKKVIDGCGFKNTPVLYDEWGAAACGFKNVEDCPTLIFRETIINSAYYVKMIYEMMKECDIAPQMFICLSGQHEMTTDFSGFRNFFTMNHIKKPIYNAHILVSKLYEKILSYQCDNEYISAIPTENENGSKNILMVYCNDELGDLLSCTETVYIDGLKGKDVSIYRIDKNNTNPYEAYKKMNTDTLNKEQIATLKKDGVMKSEDFVADDNKITIEFTANSVILIEVK